MRTRRVHIESVHLFSSRVVVKSRVHARADLVMRALLVDTAHFDAHTTSAHRIRAFVLVESCREESCPRTSRSRQESTARGHFLMRTRRVHIESVHLFSSRVV